MTEQSKPAQPGISTGLVLILAVATGLSVANLYYAQPLLHTISNSLHVGEGASGLVVTFTQIGYALGLALLVPLGDIVQRRKLTSILLILDAIALVGSAIAPNLGVLIGVAAFVGIGSVSVQILIPLAANLATDEKRGQVVGMVMTGVLLGILLARTISGVIAGATSWRVVYWAAAAIALILAAVLFRVLPEEIRPPGARIGYSSLLRSTLALVRDEPVLRQRMLMGSFSFAAFSALWTTIGFLLAGDPYNYGTTLIGLFGLVGVAGALSGNFAGRFVDRGLQSVTTIVFASGTTISFLLIYFGKTSLAMLIVGILLLDIGIQGLQITNQSVIYQLAPHARGRITANYVTSNFIGGAIGSAAASAIFDSSLRWGGVCLFGGLLGVGILVTYVVSRVRAGTPARRGISPAR
ncbi:MAG TPA: MFS transporter [Thermomicrobiales bacterium]|nr:MFS transporter [Thermomicrobiales bacterium]